MQKTEYPFYLKATIILLGLVLLVYILQNMAGIFVPLAFAVVFAILLNPLVNKLMQYKINQVAAILIIMLLAVIATLAVVYFLSSQIAGLTDNLPVLKARFEALMHTLSIWVHHKFGIAVSKQMQMVNDSMGNSKSLIGSTLNTALGTLSVLFLIPVYIFLFLYYKTLMLNFFFKIFAEENAGKVSEILGQTKAAIQSYMFGLLLEAVVVAVMNTTALLIIGVKYAFLIGILGALLNILPYIGGIIAISLPVLMATVTSDGYSMQLWIIVAYIIIQFIDNNILVPQIVSSKVQLNALISILAVLSGGALWGIGGMFLSIPIVAIIKIIFDRIDELKPWGQLLGNEVPTHYKGFSLKRRKKKSIAAPAIPETS